MVRKHSGPAEESQLYLSLLVYLGWLSWVSFCQNRCAVIASIRLPTHTTCSVGVKDNISSRGCDGFDRSTGRLHVRSRRFFRADVDPDTARRDDRGGLW